MGKPALPKKMNKFQEIMYKLKEIYNYRTRVKHTPEDGG